MEVVIYDDAGKFIEAINNSFMLNVDQAREMAIQEMARLTEQSKIKLVLLDEYTITFEYGWVFFYDAEDPHCLLAGNAPILIDKFDGTLHSTGTAYDTEYYIEKYRESKTKR